jgi:hypothetical protein
MIRASSNLDLLGKLTIGGDLAAHPFAGVQHRRVVAVKPEADHCLATMV